MPQQLAAKAVLAALGLAYLDAKFTIGWDLHAVKSIVKSKANVAKKVASDRVNAYCTVEDHYDATPDKVFIAYERKEWTYKQAMGEIHRWANFFLSLDVKKGEVVAVDFTNKPNFVWILLGLWSIGASPALINFNLTDASLLHCVSIAKSRFLIFDEEVEAEVRTIKDQLTNASVVPICVQERNGCDWAQNFSPSDLASQSTTQPPSSRRNNVALQDMAALIYTSGSTGLPKAAIVAWHKFVSGALTSSLVIGVTPEDRYYSCMPLYHGTAAVLGLGLCISRGATYVIGHKFSHATFWKDISENDATVIQYVGEVCRFLCAAPTSPYERKHRLRLAYGNGMRPDVWERFRQRFNVPQVAEFYAATEGVGGSINTNTGPFGAGAVGRRGPIAKLLSGGSAVIVKIDVITEDPIRNSSGFCERVALGEPGELLNLIDRSQADKTFMGYYGNEKASASKLMENVLVKGDLYQRSGDLMSENADGFLYFNDRLGDTFRFQSENVSTTEVTEAIGAYPGVAEANVYGIEVPRLDGRVGCVAIVADPEIKLNFIEFASHLSKALPKYAVPRFLRFVRNAEKTGNHKQLKVGLRKEGIDPRKIGGDEVYWLQNGAYVKFGEADWNSLIAGKARL